MAAATAMLDAFPDLLLELRRDGKILGVAGGLQAQALQLAPDAVGKALADVYPAPTAALLKQLARRAIASRNSCETEFIHVATRFEARISALGADRALCVIRALTELQPGSGGEDVGVEQTARFNRRRFLRRLSDSIATALLNGRPLALAIVHVEGLKQIGKLMDPSLAEQAIASALGPLAEAAESQHPAPWFAGHLADSEMAVVVSSGERDRIESQLLLVCERLSNPVSIGDAVFQLRPRAGVAILGQDATTEQALIEHARTALFEARRMEMSAASFFSDTMKLRALTRIDVALELREAISNGEIGLSYRGRHDLASGELIAMAGYLRWNHPMRGTLPPAQFLPVAAATGLSTALSRSILDSLQRDFRRLGPHVAPGVRISFGALRHHVMDSAFFKDVDAIISSQTIPAERLEVRISERSYVAKESRDWRLFADKGVQVVVDEVGRKMSSIDRLARAPISGLQLDRKCAAALETDGVADRVGRAVLGIAKALGLTPITTAVDSERQRKILLAQGWTQGSGDLFGSVGEFTRDGLKSQRDITGI